MGATTAQLEHMLSIPFPARLTLESVRPELEEYASVAKALKFYPPPLFRTQLSQLLAARGHALYDYDHVCRWLAEVKGKARFWCWSPLREEDRATPSWGMFPADGSYSRGFCQPYPHLVPLHALEKVAWIEAEFGDRVAFFVSDYAAIRPDPFIMVRPRAAYDGNPADVHMVFDHWDEPGFGDRKAP